MNPKAKALMSSIDKRVETMTKKLKVSHTRGHFGKPVSGKKMKSEIQRLGE